MSNSPTNPPRDADRRRRITRRRSIVAAAVASGVVVAAIVGLSIGRQDAAESIVEADAAVRSRPGAPRPTETGDVRPGSGTEPTGRADAVPSPPGEVDASGDADVGNPELIVEQTPRDPDVESEVVDGDPGSIVRDFFESFVAQHRDGDVAGLIESLHPSARLSFGEQTCADYVERTTGSIADATVSSVGALQELSMRTPGGVVVFPEAVPFTLEFELIDGTTLVSDGHLPINGDNAHWLTMCGVDVP